MSVFTMYAFERIWIFLAEVCVSLKYVEGAFWHFGAFGCVERETSSVSPDRLLASQKFIYLLAANRNPALPALAWITKHSWHFANILDRVIYARYILR